MAATHTPIIINLNPDTDGVDTPYFELSKENGDTVSWENAVPGLSAACTVTFGPGSPFIDEPIVIPHGVTKGPYTPNNAPPAPTGHPSNKIYKYYKYTLKCGSVTIDPGGGVKP